MVQRLVRLLQNKGLRQRNVLKKLFKKHVKMLGIKGYPLVARKKNKCYIEKEVVVS